MFKAIGSSSLSVQGIVKFGSSLNVTASASVTSNSRMWSDQEGFKQFRAYFLIWVVLFRINAALTECFGGCFGLDFECALQRPDYENVIFFRFNTYKFVSNISPLKLV